MTMENDADLAAARRALISRHRAAVHEAGHAVSCIAWGIPLYAASIAPPQVRHGLWFGTCDGTRWPRLAAMRLAGPAAERLFCGTVEDDSVDLETARSYLVAAKIAPSEVDAEIEQLRAEAESLMRSAWARQRIPAIANALLKHATLGGEAIKALCEPLHAPAPD